MALIWLFCFLTAYVRISGSFSHGVANWDHFLTSEVYKNRIIVLELNNILPSLYISKENSLVTARMKCSQACVVKALCEAFNFFDNGDFYICQLLPDNFCTQKQRLTLQIWPGGYVWDKLRPGVRNTCLEQKFQGQTTANFCSIAFPGCRGTWPACTDCDQSCFDCRTRIFSPYVGLHRCTIWPEGPAMNPIFARCFESCTFFIFRSVDCTAGSDIDYYLMSPVDMGRLSKLKIYGSFQLYVRATDGVTYVSTYRFSSIDTSGKITNLSWITIPLVQDGFDLKGQTVSLDFVNVASDPYSCGSFWLLDPNNATYCPGGKVSILGKSWKLGLTMFSGIRWPPAGNKILEQGDIKLC